jgi:predicted nucleic acid-binding protein
MRYLVDSDWIADYLVGKQEAVGLLDRLVPDGIGVSLITLGEIYEGIYYGRDPKRNSGVWTARNTAGTVRSLPQQ